MFIPNIAENWVLWRIDIYTRYQGAPRDITRRYWTRLDEIDSLDKKHT